MVESQKLEKSFTWEQFYDLLKKVYFTEMPPEQREEVGRMIVTPSGEFSSAAL